MGSFVNTLIRIMLGWLQSVVRALWTTFTSSDGRTFFSWIGDHWLILAGVLCAIGLSADLCVYLFRWKPFHRSGRGEDAETETAAPVAERNIYREPVPETLDLSQWENAPEPESVVRKEPEPEPVVREEPEPEMTVTRSGYHVPADSPYRRPPEQRTETDEDAGEPLPEAERQEPEPPVNLHRRRRLRVSELFSDPEEELKSIEAPQQVIDSRRAYHEPVYPRGWRKEEDKQE